MQIAALRVGMNNVQIKWETNFENFIRIRRKVNPFILYKLERPIFCLSPIGKNTIANDAQTETRNVETISVHKNYSTIVTFIKCNVRVVTETTDLRMCVISMNEK